MTGDKTPTERVQDVIQEVRPFLQADGGDVEFVSFDEASGRVRLRLRGACSHCPSSTYTLQMHIAERLREAVPEVRSVEPVR